MVEKYFNAQIVSLYSDNGGEFIKLKNYLAQHGISHFTTPPYNPELNTTAERQHHHIVETGRALLHHANLPPSYWSFAFIITTYFINRLPPPILNMKSPYEILHKTHPNLLHLHSCSCLCFPWLRPYTTNKLKPQSKPCLIVGYSPSQYAYHYLDPITRRVYTSYHVSFHAPSFTPNSPQITHQIHHLY